MMVLELQFTDHPDRLAARPAHRQRLQALAAEGRLVLAGPWADDDGALLVFDVDEAGLDAIVADDPYYRTSGVVVARTRRWTPVVAPAGR